MLTLFELSSDLQSLLSSNDCADICLQFQSIVQHVELHDYFAVVISTLSCLKSTVSFWSTWISGSLISGCRVSRIYGCYG